MDKISKLFTGWDDTILLTCLAGYMGKVDVNNKKEPTAAIAQLGDFCFLAGHPDETLLNKVTSKIITPQNGAWEHIIEKHFGTRAKKTQRYAIQKCAKFDTELLQKYVSSLELTYSLKVFDGDMYDIAMSQEWSRDFCSNFRDKDDFLDRGIGVGAVHNGVLISGAASYSVYDGGIEIEIDTKPEHRNRGLATACGAALILECLDKGIYPSWDAQDLRSVHLAEKLGYNLDRPYTVYILE